MHNPFTPVYFDDEPQTRFERIALYYCDWDTNACNRFRKSRTTVGVLHYRQLKSAHQYTIITELTTLLIILWDTCLQGDSAGNINSTRKVNVDEGGFTNEPWIPTSNTRYRSEMNHYPYHPFAIHSMQASLHAIKCNEITFAQLCQCPHL